jgi:hypothetical protein
MVLDDIVFTDGDIQNFILERDSGTLNSPIDILYDEEMCMELPEKVGTISATKYKYDYLGG